eukprot:7667459-Prorocentrum_lima.AAC.1
MCFDPVVHAVEEALHCAAPSFVDDMALLTFGPRQTVLGELLLLRLTESVGLHMDGHTCRWLSMEQYHPDTVRILAGTTARLTPAEQGFVTVSYTHLRAHETRRHL